MSSTRAIIMAFHKYTPFGDEFYAPILDFQLKTLKKYENEFDRLCLVDSTWNIDLEKVQEYFPITKFTIFKVDPSKRYYDAYKEVLPQVQEDLVLFMDNDMVVYREKCIEDTFEFLNENYGVVSIYDTIGTMKVGLPDGKNKFCPYWFATRKETLMKYLGVDWSPDSMPYTETFGLLTEAMLLDKIRPYEWPEDKESIWFSGETTNGDDKSNDTGTYHIRSGSTPAYLLATKKYGDKKTYKDYLEKQPMSELLRHCAWYEYMGGNATEIWKDFSIDTKEWDTYMYDFKKYHNL